MLIKDIVKNYVLKEKTECGEINVEFLCEDHREVKNGALFFCVDGLNVDGHEFALEAKKRGAVALVCSKKTNLQLPCIYVEDVREAMSVFAANFYGNPSKKMKLIGVTGTNGKTSTCHIIAEILTVAGIKSGVIGTLGIKYGEVNLPSKLTTPNPIFLNKVLKDMLDSGVECVAMEVSAHAIALKKINGLDFAVKVFTNLTQDHLDFFKTMENYYEAKKSFIDSPDDSVSVYNTDDEYGRKTFLQSNKKSFSYGIENPADVFAINVKQNENGTSFVMNAFDQIIRVNSKLNGIFNVYNSLAAATACAIIGVSAESIGEGLNSVNVVSGRAEAVENKKGLLVYIDYAHTPDGLRNILCTLRGKAEKRLICLFGCGGNRDKDKRAKMGEIAGKYADYCVLTSDNPRFEDPVDIIRDIEFGLKKQTDRYVTVEDRKKAINYAVSILSKGDILLVAGKGAENYQEIMGVFLPFNDRKCIEEALK